MKPPPSVDSLKRTIEQLSRTERVELTQWMLQRYIAGGSTADVASDGESAALASAASGSGAD